MAINDPLGDMLTRIRNAQMRRRPKVSTPASNLRARVLDVLVEEGYIRGYTRVEHKGGHAELEIELKYANGQPAIREIKRVSKPGRRVYSPVQRSADRRQRPRRRHPVDAQGRDVGLAGARGERRRRDPLQRVLRRVQARRAAPPAVEGGASDVAHRQEAGPGPVQRDGDGRRPDGEDEGPEGRAVVHGARGDQGREDGDRHRGQAARGDQEGARHVGHVAHHGRQPDQGRDQGLLADAGDPRRRLPRRHEGQGPAAAADRLQPRRRCTRSRPASTSRSPAPSRRSSRSPASTSRRSARSPPRSAPTARPSPTRARACAIRASTSSARKARRSKDASHGASSTPDRAAHAARAPHAARRRPASGRGCRSPLVEAHLCPGHRRRDGHTVAAASTWRRT